MKILVVGVGSIGERHVRCFLSLTGVELGICDLNYELAVDIGKRYGVGEIGNEIEDFDLKSFDGAVICTPANTHIPIATKLVKEGLHLLIEKPLSTNVSGISDLREIADRRKCIISVGYVYRSDPVLSSMRGQLIDGRFGEPKQIIGFAGQNFPFYRPGFRDTYYVSKEQGGGAIHDAMTHLINAAEWIVGPVSRVIADSNKQALSHGSEVEDTVHTITNHKNGVMGVFGLNQYQMPNECVITVVCTEGTIRFERHNSRWISTSNPEEEWKEEMKVPQAPDDFFIRQAENFIDSINGECRPFCSFDEAKQTLDVNLAILESSLTGCPVLIGNS